VSPGGIFRGKMRDLASVGGPRLSIMEKPRRGERTVLGLTIKIRPCGAHT
jgi:hypothetical protein